MAIYEDSKNKKRILVIGDSMLDIYCFGKVSRISPEAPVPVLCESKGKIKYVLGGAANVAVNSVAAGANVDIFTAIGKDREGEEILRQLILQGVSVSYVYKDGNRITTTKRRYIGQNNQQILRVDKEDTTEFEVNKLKIYLDELECNISNYSLVLFSDYNKGLLIPEFLQYVVRIANEKGIPTLIDVKDKNFNKYKAATLLKPNKVELSRLTGMEINTLEDAIEASCMLCRRCVCKYVLTTLGAEGMILTNDKVLIRQVQSTSKEVYDVTGAGDTSIAYLAVGIAQGVDILEAMEFANYAAGVQVSKLGTSIIYPWEVKKAMEVEQRINISKQLNGIERIREEKARGKKIVFTNGCFDILHAGHVKYLKKAKALGDCLIVGVNSDASVRRLKGIRRPINSLSDRILLLSSLYFVDYVISFESDTPLHLIECIMPDVLVKGGDYEVETIVGANCVKENGGVVVTIPLYEGKSTTEIIKKIL